MKRLMVYLGCLMLAPPAYAQTAATEKAEKRLSHFLAPAGKMFSPVFLAGPVSWKASRTVEDIAAPISPYQGAPVRLPEPARLPIRPRAVPEGVALIYYREQPAAPKDVELPVKPLIRLPSVDVNVPLPIPILARPQKDRASLADPTLETSLDAALQPLAPIRRDPVPFVPLNLPDPFENVRVGQLRHPPEEDPVPPVIPLQRPTR